MKNQRSTSDDLLRPIGYGLTHKLRNSLNAARTHLALLEKFLPVKQGRVPQQLGKLDEALGHIEEILKEFLAYASPEQDHCQDVDFAAIVKEVLSFLAADLEQGRIKVISSFSEKLPNVYADPAKLKQAILRLVVNARQAMPHGGELTLRLRPHGREQILFEVADTGSGIEERDRPRVCEPFFSTRPGGLGLSLAIVKRTIGEWGGKIRVDSQPEKGTVFRITVPTSRRLRAVIARRDGRQRPLTPVSD